MLNSKVLCAVLLLTLNAWSLCTLVQDQGVTCTNSSTTCAVTVNSTGSGNAIIALSTFGATGASMSSVSGGGTYSHCAGCTGNITGGGNTGSSDIFYTLASTSGTTSITITRSAGTFGWNSWIEEVSCTGAMSLDASGNVDDSTGHTTQSGVALTLGGTNDFIFQIAITSSQNINSVSSPYALVSFGTAKQKNAKLINTVSGTAPTWTLAASSTLAGSAIAIKDNAPPAGHNQTLLTLGVGE